MDAVKLEVLWSALINTVNEQAKALQRSAFSPVVREAGDLATALFNERGLMIAQAVTGTPGHINSLAAAAREILKECPVESLEVGDVLITNDPYRTAGQLLDVTVLYPVWRKGRIIGFFGSTIHHTDIGGYGIGAGARDIYEEGLWIPVTKLMEGGKENLDVWKFILSNVREPYQVRGDLYAQLSSGEVGAQRLNALCDKYGLDDIVELSEEILTRSEESVRASIHALPAGTFKAESLLDLADGTDIIIRVALTIDSKAGRIIVDYVGSSQESASGINVAKNYTHAYTTFAIRSVLNPDIPNNAGSLAPIEVVAPEGSIVNARPPAPCSARHVVGMFLPMPIMKALAQVAPEKVVAEGAGPVWTCQVSGKKRDGRPFITSMFSYAGGMGARANKPGLSATSFPTGVAAVPIEIVEQMAPIIFLRKALRRGSGGTGRQPGGDGQVVEFYIDSGSKWTLNAVVCKLRHGPEGLFGGGAGLPGVFTVNGIPITTVKKLDLEPEDIVKMELPGGGGYGSIE